MLQSIAPVINTIDTVSEFIETRYAYTVQQFSFFKIEYAEFETPESVIKFAGQAGKLTAQGIKVIQAFVQWLIPMVFLFIETMRGSEGAQDALVEAVLVDSESVQDWMEVRFPSIINAIQVAIEWTHIYWRWSMKAWKVLLLASRRVFWVE